MPVRETGESHCYVSGTATYTHSTFTWLPTAPSGGPLLVGDSQVGLVSFGDVSKSAKRHLLLVQKDPRFPSNFQRFFYIIHRAARER